jgi:hypothetical protein
MLSVLFARMFSSLLDVPWLCRSDARFVGLWVCLHVLVSAVSPGQRPGVLRYIQDVRCAADA